MDASSMSTFGLSALSAVGSIAAIYQCVLASSARPRAIVTKEQARYAIIAAHWEIRALVVALNAISNLAGRHGLLDKGLDPRTHRGTLVEGKQDEWRRYCNYYSDFEEHVKRLLQERQTAQNYYDTPSARATPALKRLVEIDTSLRQMLAKLSVTLGDVLKLTIEGIALADKNIQREFRREIARRSQAEQDIVITAGHKHLYDLSNESYREHGAEHEHDRSHDRW